ncbi:MAG: nucleotidyltransferase family protein [Ruminococcaceae bacterium]|nr:nucleotidyltransferase family protein [Oscillospiraceae bacterium]
MEVAGIVCEYNPFHNGHQYHIEQTKKISDACICIMSGNFVQRGDAACVNKFIRAEAAIKGGADLVLELPAVFACRSAETFAHGAISILEQTGIVSLLSFGSETAQCDELIKAGAFFAYESEDFRKRLTEELDKGISFPVARANAVKEESFGFLLDHPNDLLGIEYCKSITLLRSDITPCPILRYKTGHHDKHTQDHFSSASYLRMHPNELETNSPFAPLLRDGGFPVNTELFQSVLLAHLRRISADELSQTADCTEGLEYRLKQAALEGETLQDVIALAKTKRYTQTRIQRILINSYLGILKDSYIPEYFRVLSANKKGTELLRMIKQKGNLPIITNLSKQKIDSKALEIDINAGNFYALLQSKNRQGGMDYTTSPRFLD